MPTATDSQGAERVLNWSPGPPDPRDYQLTDHLPLRATPRPDFVDLDPGFPNDITDQGQTGECTAHGSLNDMEFILKLLGFKVDQYSHKAQYALTRLEGGLPLGTDSGAYVRDTCKVLAKIGAVLAALHPDTTDFRTPPSSAAVADAAKRKALKYVSVPVNVDAIKDTLAAGFPVIIGFSVPRAFMSVGADGLVSYDLTLIPNAGHCVIVTGYDDRIGSLTFGRFKIRNSWGKGWGAQGRAYVQYQWLMALGADFWTIMTAVGESVTPPPPPPAPKTIKVLMQPQDAIVGTRNGGGFAVQVDPGITVTAQLRNTVGKTYGGPSVVKAAENGVAQFGPLYFNNPHIETDALQWGLTALGFEPAMTVVFKVTSPVVPPVPPVPPAPRVITGILTEFHDWDKAKVTLAYSDGTGKVVEV